MFPTRFLREVSSSHPQKVPHSAETQRLANSTQPQRLANQPQKLATDVDPTKLTSAKNIQQATSQVNRMARRDPALYPLSIIMVGIAAVTGYFMMSKTTETALDRSVAQRGIVNPWDDESKHEVQAGQTAAFKYRYKTQDGHMEDAYPTMNVDVRRVKDDAPHKFHTS